MVQGVDEQVLRTSAALAVLLIATFLLMTAAGLGLRRDLVVSAVRALVQLVAVALVIAWIFAHPQGAVLYIVVMLVAATVTAVNRIGCGYRLSGGVLLAIVAGAAATLVLVSATGALAWDVQALLPFAAQMIGGAMTAALLAGSRLRDDALARWDEVEGYLALGAQPRAAVTAIGRRATHQSLAPALDQTKSAGLVLLPGAFVGMLLGGASPMTAAQLQLLVLFGLILAQTIGAILTTFFLAASVGTIKPIDWRHATS